MVEDSRPTKHRITGKLRALRFDAGALSLNLVATVGRRGSYHVERLDTVDRLAEWLSGVNLAVRPEDVDATLLSQLHTLREAIYQVLSASLNKETPATTAIDTVNAYVGAESAPSRLVVRRGAIEVVPPEGNYRSDAIPALIARDLINHFADGSWPEQLRACEAPDCRMLYVDASQGRRRRWCSMRYCGNRAKAARHRDALAGNAPV